MNALNSPKKSDSGHEKILGKKIKRFQNNISPNIKELKRPPIISQSTLNQIEKVIKNKKKKFG